LLQRLAGDTAGAKAAAEQARTTLESLRKNQPDNSGLAAQLSQAYAVLGEKDSALKEAERSIMLLPSVKDRVNGPACEENLALIQTMVGENSRAISTLTRLLQTPYGSQLYGPGPITPGTFKTRSALGSVARRSRFPKALRGKAVLKLRSFWLK
jgi:hypothetical protein